MTSVVGCRPTVPFGNVLPRSVSRMSGTGNSLKDRHYDTVMTSLPTTTLPTVRLKIERRSSHPEVFQKMVERPAVKVPTGAVVDVLDRDGKWVGRGLYNAHSRISLRILTADPNEAIDPDWFARKVARAVELRRDILKLDDVTDAYRVVHSEADGLSGLVVDLFGSTLVLEFFAAGMYKQREAIQAALLNRYPGARFYWFAEEHVGKQES